MKKAKYEVVTIDFVSPKAGQVSKKLSFIGNGCQWYFNAQHLLIKLSNKDRAFFDYLCEVMNYSDNEVFIDDHLKAAFIKHIGLITSSKTKVTKASVAQSVLQFKSLGLILSTENKARYIVNPKYVFKGSAFQRKGLLKRLIELRIVHNLSIAALLNEPEDTFLDRQGTPEK